MITRLLLTLLFFLVSAPMAMSQDSAGSRIGAQSELALLDRLSDPFQASLAMLRPAVIVEADLVTLGDLFDNVGQLAETPVFRAPAPGTRGRVAIHQIAQAAQRAGLEHFDLAGLVDITVERRGTLLGAHDLENMVIDELNSFLIQRRGEGAGRYDLSFIQQTNPVMIGAELAGRLRVDLLAAPTQRSERFTALVRLPDGRELARFEGRAEHLIQAPVLMRAVSRGDVVRRSDVRLQEMPFNRTIGTPTLLDMADIVGQAANRSIRAGSPISPDDLTAPLMVERQDLVTLVFRQGALALTVSARALDDGSEGQAIDVMNLQSNRVVRGMVIGDGQVQVLAPMQVIAAQTAAPLVPASNLERIQ